MCLHGGDAPHVKWQLGNMGGPPTATHASVHGGEEDEIRGASSGGNSRFVCYISSSPSDLTKMEKQSQVQICSSGVPWNSSSSASMRACPISSSSNDNPQS
jgi:hypothetical protein